MSATLAPPRAPFEIDVEALSALPKAEREVELWKVRKLNSLQKHNPLWRYVPHLGELGYKLDKGFEVTGEEDRGQVAYHEIATPYGAYVAGNRSGKTHGGVADDLIQTLPEAMVPPWLLPYKRWGLGDEEFYCRLVGPDIPRWLEGVMLPKVRRLVPPAALYKGSWAKAYNDRHHKLQFADGSWWDFLTHDMEIDAYAGADLMRIHFDEEPKGERGKEQYEESLGRLVDHDGEVRWTLTPLQGMALAYNELTDRFGNPRDDEECVVVRGDIDHNPHLSEAGRRRFLKRFAKDPLKLAARKSGLWVHFAGTIYHEFDERRHVVPAREIPRRSEKAKPSVAIYASIDPGINENHKAALVMAWLDERDVLEVFHTLAIADATVSDVADHYHKICAALNFKPRWTTIDPSAKNRSHASGRSIQDEYRKHKIHTLPGQNSREAGFNAVKERLKTGRLVIHSSEVELVEEIKKYRWKEARNSRSEDAPKAEPIKRDDDRLDALRYLVMSMPRSARSEAEEEAPLSSANRAFRNSLKRLGKRRRGRIGGYVPA